MSIGLFRRGEVVDNAQSPHNVYLSQGLRPYLMVARMRGKEIALVQKDI